jgi:hypothetical protein
MPRFIPIVFVSSTKEDLEDYRQALITIFPGLDVLFRGMEYFGSRPRRPKEVMLQELRECDLYVGILAHRYGSLDQETGISYTELEYREAIRYGIPTVFFLIDPHHPVDPAKMEKDPAKAAKLQDLKAEVRANYNTVTFTTPDDLAHKTAEAIQKWTQENTARWQAMECAAQPLSDREKEQIDNLLQGDGTAVRKLANLQSQAALEHFLGLLRRSDTSRNTKESILDALNANGFRYRDRALDVLIAATGDADASIRSYAALHIGERAVVSGVLTATAVESLERLASDSDDEVRSETAHALGKIGSRYRDFTQQCITILTQLGGDPMPDVSTRAEISLRLCR